MDGADRETALGLLVLMGLLALPLLLPPAPPPPPPTLERPPDAATAAAFGFPIDPDTADPAAWRALPGVGPTRALDLARAAAEGRLRRPEDLLQVPGIGIKMAADLAAHIRWTDPGPDPGSPPP